MGADADRALIDALADLVVKCAPYGAQDVGFVFVYLVPTGPVHRAIALLHEQGVITRPGFDGRATPPTTGDFMTSPTVGRIVHYRSRGSADGVFEPECRAAVVTETGPDNRAGLCVMNPTGLYFCQDVAYAPTPGLAGGDEPAGGTWHWPERA